MRRCRSSPSPTCRRGLRTPDHTLDNARSTRPRTVEQIALLQRPTGRARNEAITPSSQLDCLCGASSESRPSPGGQAACVTGSSRSSRTASGVPMSWKRDVTSNATTSRCAMSGHNTSARSKTSSASRPSHGSVGTGACRSRCARHRRAQGPFRSRRHTPRRRARCSVATRRGCGARSSSTRHPEPSNADSAAARSTSSSVSP